MNNHYLHSLNKDKMAENSFNYEKKHMECCWFIFTKRFWRTSRTSSS